MRSGIKNTRAKLKVMRMHLKKLLYNIPKGLEEIKQALRE
jgi:hypothetical protein